MSFLKKVGNLGMDAIRGASDIVFGTNFTGVQAGKDTNKANLANQWKLLENERVYNTPSAVMQRYRDAGLNANLIYGNSGTGNVSAHYATQVSPGGVGGDFSKAQRMIDAYNAVRTSDLVVDNAEVGLANSKKLGEKIDAETERVKAETNDINFGNSLLGRTLKVLGNVAGIATGFATGGTGLVKLFNAFRGAKTNFSSRKY